MKWTNVVLPLAALPSAWAWGGFGHITVAYLASDFVSPDTTSYFQQILHNSTDHYLAGIATWADSIRYTRWGKFTGVFHFIDAKDNPPILCNVDLERDCKKEGCVVSAIANYTSRLLDTSLPFRDRQDAAKFIVHFVGDIHQPLHDEDIKKGGNAIPVLFDGQEYNLHHVWDTSIPEKLVGGVNKSPFGEAAAWADQLAREIRDGKYAQAARDDWLSDMNVSDPINTALAWAREGNKYVCSHVLPEGEEGVSGNELGGDYYEAAVPVVESQVAKAGFRLAAWMDALVSILQSQDHVGEL